MFARIVIVVALFAAGFGGFLLWSRHRAVPTSGPPTATSVGPDATAPPATSGVAWDKPARWIAEPGRAMRLATYQVPAAAAGSAPAQCAIYYFGAGQGGSVKLNLERWSGEFQGGAKPEVSRFTADGMKVHRALLQGTYLAHVDMGEADAPAPASTLLGAIVEGPNGPIFVKLTGPSSTVATAAAEFDGMLRSMRKSAE